MSLSRSTRSNVAELKMAILPTAWGDCGISWVESRADDAISAFTGRAAGYGLLAQIVLPGLSPRELRRQLGRAGALREVCPDRGGRQARQLMPGWWDELAELLQRYFAAEPGAWPGPETLWARWSPRLYLKQLTPFQREVLEALCAVPSGQVVTYGQLARMIGRPRAARAVGAALGSNPWPVLAPCHRVIGGSGRLVGFSAPGGVASKARMLAMEGTGTLSMKR